MFGSLKTKKITLSDFSIEILTYKYIQIKYTCTQISFSNDSEHFFLTRSSFRLINNLTNFIPLPLPDSHPFESHHPLSQYSSVPVTTLITLSGTLHKGIYAQKADLN